MTIEWVVLDPNDPSLRPTFGPPCRATLDHTWRLYVSDGRASLSSGCEECDSVVMDTVGGEDVTMDVAVLGTLRSHVERYGSEVDHWWEVIPLPAIDVTHIERQRAWSDRTFGPGPRAAGVVDHIRKELDEVLEDPSDITEWADIIILAIDGASREGHSGRAIIEAVLAKHEKNEGRTWPDWRTADPNKAIEHVEDEEDAA